MTLRDLLPSEIVSLQTRCDKELREWENQQDQQGKHVTNIRLWRAAFNAGLKAGLELHK